MASRPAIVSLGIFLLFSVSTGADFIMDWLFYTEVSVIEKGLVYGETNRDAVNALLAFSIIGTLAFLLEIINLAYELKDDKTPWVDADILSLLVLWLEDIPQVIISLCLALCREEAISTIQLTKACFTLAEIAIRCVISLYKVCRKQVHTHHKKIKGAIALGAVAQLCIAIPIFYYSYTKPNGDFKTPTTLSEDTYDDSQYFTNVSAFLNMPQYSNAVGPGQKVVVNWVQLTSVTNFRASDENRETILFSLQFENNGTKTVKMALWERTNAIWSSPTCFVLDLKSGQGTQDLNTTCGSNGYFGNSSTQVFLKFRFDPPTGLFRNRIFGQIFFNMKLLENSVGQLSAQPRNRAA